MVKIKKILFAGILTISIASLLSGCGTELLPSESDDSKISMEEFNALETGITYEEAVEIVGGEGEVLSQTNIAGYSTVIYTWNGEGSIGANANATFQNNKLMSKAQVGLE